jgi:hypothetical protein
MSMSTDQIAELEWLNYEATLPLAQATPGLELELRDDVILTSSQIFPAPDTTHACLLRTSAEAADKLIDEIVNHFQERELPVTVFLSPACMPADLAQRLQKHGFVKDKEEEAWLAIEELARFKIPFFNSNIEIKQITCEEAATFANTFVEGYGMPAEVVSPLAQLVEPSVGLPGVYHYLGFVNEKPIATFSLICHRHVGILGSAGVLPEYRGLKLAENLLFYAEMEARNKGIAMLILQTTAGSLLERALRIHGFKRAFKRICYILPS